MKIINYVLISILALSCGTTKMKETNVEDIEPAPELPQSSVVDSEEKEESKMTEDIEEAKVVAEIPDFSNSEGIGIIMNFLASDELQGRESGSEGIAKAADFIEEIFNTNGIKPYFENFSLDLCLHCEKKRLCWNAVYGMGAMGYNDFTFSKPKWICS